MIVDHISNWKSYSLGEAWEKAFGFLDTLSVDAEDKEYPIDGDEIFARVMSYATKEETDPKAVLEAHRKYVDIQMTLVGSERIGVYPTHALATKIEYDVGRDVAFFEYREAARLQLSMHPGTFACLFAQDAHMPGLYTDEIGSQVKKVVVKILASLLKV